ncbi:MAG: ATP-binding protein [Pseudomonadota bacterium]
MSADGQPHNACDAQQIHLIEAVQSHGALISVDAKTLKICHVSENAETFIGVAATDLLGQNLTDFLLESDAKSIQSETLAATYRKVLRPFPLKLGGSIDQGLECLPHRNGERINLEFIKKTDDRREGWEEDDLRRQIISDLVRPNNLADLAQLSADIMRQVNGFDRVMIYRFAEDNHGEVIAESTERDDSYLGLHYPASDIPEPARRHFMMNVVRMIGDVHGTGVPILAEDPSKPLDLSFSVLRAVPDTHLQYLKNMGVAASMSVSLVANDKLWGLIASHNYNPRTVSPHTLRFAELLAGTISALLQGIENRMQLGRAIEAERIAFAMEKQGRSGIALTEVVSVWAPELMELLDAQGLVFRQSGQIAEYGLVPKERLRYRPLRAQLSEGVAATDRLRELVDLNEQQIETAAGAGYMELSGDGQDYLVLLRRHYEQVVSWAGKPETVEEKLADGSTQLNPRASFALWREERVGQSKPFDSTDLEALRIVRRALFALNSLEREHAAVLAQKEAEAEEERLRLALLDAARKTSMGELASALAHELNQPLAAVSNYINACRAQLAGFNVTLPDGFEDLMLDAVSEASRASDLVRRLRDFIAGGALQLETADLGAAIRQGADLAMVAHGSNRPELIFEFAEDLPEVWIDRIQIGQVVLNLAMNSITAMRDSKRRILTIRARRNGDMVCVSVSDTGPGIAEEMRPSLFEPFHSMTTSGMGIGLSLCRSIVEAHRGRIYAPVTETGGLVEFTLPINGEGNG